MEKLSSMKLVPGAKKVGDHWPMTAMSPMTFLPLCRILLQCRSSIPGSGRFTWERIVYPLQYSWASLVAQLVKNPPAIQETRVGKIPWRGERLPTPVFWPGEFRGLYRSWGHKELDMTASFTLLCSSVSKFCLFCDPVDCSRPGSSIHGTSQARILESVSLQLIYFIHITLYFLIPYSYLRPNSLPSAYWQPLVCSMLWVCCFLFCCIHFILLFSTFHIWVMERKC